MPQTASVENEALSQARRVAEGLGDALRDLVDAIPGQPHKPTSLARRVGMNRVTASKLLNGIGRDDPFEVLQQIPGPESLRSLTDAARHMDVPPGIVEQAARHIDDFAELIRAQFGTRDALNAAISSASESLLKRFHEGSRYDIFKGIRQLRGVEANTWLTSMIFSPAFDDDNAVAVTTIHGALGMRRLRPDVGVYFIFGKPYHAPGDEPDPSQSPVALHEFYENDPAPLVTELSGGKLIHRLTHDELGKQAIVDMLAVSHSPKGSGRYAPPNGSRRGVAIFPDIPVRTMVCDALIHRDIFPGSEPELLVYNTGVRGPANPNDPTRDIDLMEVPESIEVVPDDDERFHLTEVPRYQSMVERVFGRIGHDLSDFRLFRLRMAYPVHGFQFVMAFDAPDQPG
ncbi:MAG: hypothetical protein KDA21_14790 [Phycisphaerales bacterium]|nr:hypothetical protein [Phycisphaerales bacterium]